MSYFAIITNDYGMEPLLYATEDAAIEAAAELSVLAAYRDSTFIIVKCNIWIDIHGTAMSEVITIAIINSKET